MQTKPFTVKQTAKEKEVTSDKLITKEPLKDGQDHKVLKDGKDQKDGKEQKDQKESKEQKEHKEAKEHKDKLEKESKHEHKEISKEHLSKEAALEKLTDVPQVQSADPTAAAVAATKFVEHKLTKEKSEKVEISEKFYKNEKLEHKEYDKYFEVPQDPGGPVEARLAALEANMAQLMHFIPAEQRPDLSQGALKQESDAPVPAQEPAAEASPQEQKKK